MNEVYLSLQRFWPEVTLSAGLMLVVLAIVVVSAGFHELGHAAALHYAGGRTKGMGAGLYIVYPAFFTDVSDNYRQPRWSRVRTDLGGFYFNLIFGLVILGAYLLSGHEFLLLMMLMINLEIIHQLLPFLRLDGYWALADITGVPDFFSQMGDFARSIVPIQAWKGRKMAPLKWWGKLVFGIYMLITIPLLGALLLLMLKSVPRVLVTAMPQIQVAPAGCENRKNFQTGVGRSIAGPMMVTYLHLPPQTTVTLGQDASASHSMNLGAAGQITTAIFLQTNQRLEFDSEIMYSGCRPE